MKYHQSLVGLGEGFVRDMLVGTTVTANSAVLKMASYLGEIGVVTTTAGVDAVGVVMEAVTYAATTPTYGMTHISPYAIYRAKATQGATANTQLTVFEGTGTSKTQIDSSSAPGVDITGGSIFCVEGTNKNQRCIVVSNVASTSVTATNGFTTAPVSGDKFVAVPWSFGSKHIQLSTNLDQADASIVYSTGVDVRVVDCTCDYEGDNAQVWVDFIFSNHVFNEIAD